MLGLAIFIPLLRGGLVIVVAGLYRLLKMELKKSSLKVNEAEEEKLPLNQSVRKNLDFGFFFHLKSLFLALSSFLTSMSA